MSSESPDVILYDVNGNPLAVQNATAIPASTSGILTLGSDGTNSRYLTVDTSGRQLVVGAAASGTAIAGNPLYLGGKSPTGNAIGVIADSVGSLINSVGGNQFTVQTNATITTSGSTVVTNNDYGTQQISLIINITASPTGTTPTLTYTIQELDPGNGTTVLGNSASSAALNTTGTTIITLTSTTSNNIKVSWVITGTTPSFTGVYSTLVTKITPTTQPVSGTVTANQGTANTLANAWSTKITDATNGPVAVKPPSTAAVATDPALVVAISPNNSLNLSANDVTGTGNLNALNATAQVNMAGLASVGMQLVAGTLIGTIVPEISMDGGTTWVSTFFDDPATSNIVSSIVFSSSNTATTRTIVGAGGASQARVRVSAFTSGAATCNMRATQIIDPSPLFGGATGSTLPPVVMQDGGSVTTAAPTYTTGTLNALSLNTTGDLRVVGKVTDGTNVAAVKAASTAPVATDPALVVSLSPNTVLPITGDRIVTGTATNSGDTVVINAQGLGDLGIYVTGSLIATLIPEATIDGVNWFTASIYQSPITNGTSTPIATITSAGKYIGTLGGYNQFRLRANTTGGTATITLEGSVSSSVVTGVVSVSQGSLNASIGNSWWTQIADATNGPVAVKPPSTAAVATDKALVVAISPNNTVGIAVNDTTTSGTLGALNATVQLAVTGENNAGMQLSAGTLIGTIVPEISMDGGTTWVQGMFDDPTTSNVTSSIVFASANTAATKTIVGVGGSSHVRIRVSAYTSGSATCALRASEMNDPTVLFGGSAGSALPPVVAQDGGSVTTSAPTYTTGTLNALSLNTTGDLRVIGKVTDGTNVAAVKAASTAAVATDPALVVAISPNNTISSTTGDVVSTGALGALNAAVQVITAGLDTVGFQLAAGTLIGTILPEVSFDGGTTWNSTYFDSPNGGKVATIVFASANTATSATIVGVGGSGISRVRVSAYTSGTANITVRATTRTDPSVLFANPAGSTSAPPSMAYVGSSVTTSAPAYTTGTINALSLNTTGDLRVIGKVTDGTNTAAVKAASTAPVATDPALVVTLSPNSSGHIKGTLEPLYGTNNQAVTITLTSLINYVANTASNAAASAAIDNTTTLYEDVLLFFKFTTNTGTATTGYVNVYGYGTVDGGTTYPEGITGSAASIQVTSPPNLVLIAQVNATTASKTFTYGPVSFCRMYGLDRLPAKWGVVVTNNTGAAFTATAGNYAITYQGINGQLV